MDQVFDQHRTSAVILAAGMSTRMGSPKMLLPIAGESLVSHVVRSYLRILPAENIVVVTGFESVAVADCLRKLNVRTIFNSNFAAGEMLSSVQTGIGAVEAGSSDCFLALGDQPLVKEATLFDLVQSHRTLNACVSQPSFEDQHGHPILLSSRTFGSILAIPRGQTLKSFIKTQQVNYVVTDDPSVIADVDTPADYQRLLQQIRSEKCLLAEVS